MHLTETVHELFIHLDHQESLLTCLKDRLHTILVKRKDAQDIGSESLKKIQIRLLNNLSLIESLLKDIFDWIIELYDSLADTVSITSSDMGKSKSEVWKYFVKNSEKNEATCSLCGKVVRSAGNTTNLRSHLQTNHPKIKLEIQKNAKSTAAASTKASSSSLLEMHESSKSPEPPSKKIKTNGGIKAIEANKRLVFLIAKDKMSYSIGEKEGFRKFVNFVAPLYKIPNRNAITE
ncbi:hypothetical protein TSAR_012542 [Trichomalopsis sarcophagae]|uniref:BED-type domain-containing protein n=1 Tax=Trichomalopsis sarcophagae TaxID=543379 RepID=A0A232EEQ6_9HYME|nr:hypothetical protein TSAR_012542 [Trichomalopsis sarcophagae]